MRTWTLIGTAATALVAIGLTVGALESTPAPPASALNYTAKPIERTPQMLNPKVVFIGDSFIGGSEMGGNRAANWSRVASRDLGWAGCSFGVGGSGWTTGMNGWTYGARIDWALSRKPSAIVFANGISDLGRGFDTTAPAMDDALSTLRAKAPDLPVIVVGQIKVRDEQSPFIEQMNKNLAEVAADHDAIFIDATSQGWFDGEARDLLGSDRFHPTNAGHVHLAQRFVEAVREGNVELRKVSEEDTVRGCALPNYTEKNPDGSPASAD